MAKDKRSGMPLSQRWVKRADRHITPSIQHLHITLPSRTIHLPLYRLYIIFTLASNSFSHNIEHLHHQTPSLTLHNTTTTTKPLPSPPPNTPTMSTTTSPKKAILFLGATGGCGLSALRRSLEAGHTCIALCRTPSKLSSKLPASLLPNLKLEQGNAHDVSAVARCLVHPNDPSRVVDMVVTSIGGAFSLKTGLDDVNVCGKGANALVEALASVRKSGNVSGQPWLVGVSSTGLTDAGRDIPLLLVPLYHGLLKVPHKDKKAMEDILANSGERFTIVRAAWLTDGPEKGGIRVGVEDVAAGKFEKKEIGWSISREDVGRWIFEHLVEGREEKYAGKAVGISY
ncbi:hypothetical protein GE09DRAFT_1161233 [Coniochaeta sp. 2T2.1]|nr:hypothetical protein GE09DRAFT_1161233 [Coniochaeta sp. 2T2.1]